MHVMLELHVADVLVQHSGTAEAPAGPNSEPAAAAQQGMHIDQVGLRALGSSMGILHHVQLLVGTLQPTDC
jgi:hypothetical protein